MAKRTAETDINHDNWDSPYESEDSGTFKTACKDDLQKRQMKVARRRLKTSGNNDAVKTAFANFTGFKPTVSTQNSTPTSTKSFGFLMTPSSMPTSSEETPKTNGTTHTVPSAKTEVTPQQKYLANLQQLNRSVSDWIKTHVDANPVCILTPVFNDYDKHLQKLQEERDSSTSSTKVSSSPTSSPQASSSLTSVPKFSFSNTSTNTSTKFFMSAPSSTENSNTLKAASADTKTKSLFGFLEGTAGTGKSPLSKDVDTSKPNTPSIFSSFKSESSGSSLLTKPDPASLMVNPFISVLKKDDKTEEKPFSTSNGPTAASSSRAKDQVDEEGESDEPPKVEFTPIKEEGSVFSTRCKVFVKKDNNYKDRGLGTLFIKKVGEDKHQLLVRAETVLGNILVNVLLGQSIPTQRMGKNNVMLVCLPTPQEPPPPTTVLLRVKTETEADDLLATINKYKH